jgi:two-component system LytT family response regulator
MNIIKAVIIDDDEFIHHQLADKLRLLCPDVTVIGYAENAIHGLSLIETVQPDIVFLDIQMPDVNGFELLNKFNNPKFKVVFITSYNQYAIQAIRYSALDYLLKPINDEELISAVDRFRKSRATGYMKVQIDNLMHNLSKNDGEFRLVIATRQGDVSLSVKRIVWCEGDSNYTHLHLSDQSRITASKTLKEFEEMLPEAEFLRVHKSHMVNIAFVNTITRDGQLLMNNDFKLEVAKRRLKEVKQLIENRNNSTN